MDSLPPGHGDHAAPVSIDAGRTRLTRGGTGTSVPLWQQRTGDGAKGHPTHVPAVITECTATASERTVSAHAAGVLMLTGADHQPRPRQRQEGPCHRRQAMR